MKSTVTQSRFSGRVKTASQADKSLRVAGQIAWMNTVQGQFVREGTIIAYRMDDRDYRTQLIATEAEYSSVKAEADRVVELYGKRSDIQRMRQGSLRAETNHRLSGRVGNSPKKWRSSAKKALKLRIENVTLWQEIK